MISASLTFMAKWHMQRVSAFAAVAAAAGMVAGGLSFAAGSVSARAAVPGGAVRSACHAPPGRPVPQTGKLTPGKPPLAAFRVDQIGYPVHAAKLADLMTRSRFTSLSWMLVSKR